MPLVVRKSPQVVQPVLPEGLENQSTRAGKTILFWRYGAKVLYTAEFWRNSCDGSSCWLGSSRRTVIMNILHTGSCSHLYMCVRTRVQGQLGRPAGLAGRFIRLGTAGLAGPHLGPVHPACPHCSPGAQSLHSVYTNRAVTSVHAVHDMTQQNAIPGHYAVAAAAARGWLFWAGS